MINKLHSISEFNNIIGKYDNNNVVLKDLSLNTMFLLEGVNLLTSNSDKYEEYSSIVISFLKSITDDFNVSIFIKKSINNEIYEDKIPNNISNKIINIHNQHIKNSYKIRYYISLTTKPSKKTDTLIINNLSRKILVKLEKFNIIRLNSDEIISFWASYSNLRDTKIKNKKLGSLADSYINSNLEVKNNYIVSYNGKDTNYMKMISIKEYDSEHIDSNFINDFIKSDFEFLICQNIQYINKEKFLSFLEKKITTSVEYVRDELEEFKAEVQTDRQSVFQYTFSVMLTSNNLDILNKNTNSATNLFEVYNLSNVIETYNLLTLYLSYFPNQQTFNTRLRKQSSTLISLYNLYPNNHKGFSKNEFGNKEVAVFKTNNLTNYKFNFHINDKPKALGHTIVVAFTGSGKTTLMSYLTMCLQKYDDLNILGFDKLQGMYNFCNLLGGKYSDINQEFSLNPFSLENTKENKDFLLKFLKIMGDIKDSEATEINSIKKCIDLIFTNKEEFNEEISLTLFLNSLEETEKDNLSIRFEHYRNSIFDNNICSLEFDTQLNILGMDSILKDKKMASLTSLYISHKLKETSQKSNKNFFIFYDELKDYLNNNEVSKIIVEQLVESRKIGGVISVAVQNLDFFDELDNKDTILDNFGQYIVFPTSSQEALGRLKEHFMLSKNEIDFLQSTDPSEYKVLLKNKVTQESIILDVGLSHLSKYLKVFDSDSNLVNKLKSLKEQGSNFREIFLKD